MLKGKCLFVHGLFKREIPNHAYITHYISNTLCKSLEVYLGWDHIHMWYLPEILACDFQIIGKCDAIFASPEKRNDVDGKSI